MNGMIWWGGKLIPMAEFYKVLQLVQSQKREEEKPTPSD
jgi:hypothetical protein